MSLMDREREGERGSGRAFIVCSGLTCSCGSVVDVEFICFCGGCGTGTSAGSSSMKVSELTEVTGSAGSGDCGAGGCGGSGSGP